MVDFMTDREMDTLADGVISQSLDLMIPTMMISLMLSFKNDTGGFHKMIRPEARMEFLLGTVMSAVSAAMAISMKEQQLFPKMDTKSVMGLLSHRMYMKTKEIAYKMRTIAAKYDLVDFLDGNTDTINDKAFLKMTEGVEWVVNSGGGDLDRWRRGKGLVPKTEGRKFKPIPAPEDEDFADADFPPPMMFGQAPEHSGGFVHSETVLQPIVMKKGDPCPFCHKPWG